MVSLADISKLRVYVYVPETESSEIRRGIPATLTLKEFPGRTFSGSVARFSKSLDLSTRTMLTEVDLENPDNVLYPGMYADVHLELVRHPDALQIPTTAIGTAHDGGSNFVYAVRENRLKKLPVKLGINNEGWVEVTEGLSGSEQIVKNLNAGLQDAQAITCVLADTPSTQQPGS